MIQDVVSKCLHCKWRDKNLMLMCMPKFAWEKLLTILHEYKGEHEIHANVWFEEIRKEIKKDERTRRKTKRTVQNPGSQE